MEGPDMSGEAALEVQEVGEGGPAMQVHAEVAPLMGTDTPVQLDLSQLPVEALLSALKSKPAEELLEGAGKLSAISAKVGYKQVSMQHAHSKLDSPKPRIKPDVRTACVQCRRTHFKCDSNKPCGRCVSRGWSQECSFDADEDSLQSLPPKSSVPRLRKKPPVAKAGVQHVGRQAMRARIGEALLPAPDVCEPGWRQGHVQAREAEAVVPGPRVRR
jgi:hypothetical protein